MTVRKRGNKWHYDFMIDGLRYRGAIKTARTKRQAEDVERKKIEEVHDGTYGKPRGAILLRDFVKQTYIPWAKDNKRSWRSDLSRLKPVVDFFGKRRLKDISSFSIESYKVLRLKTPVVYKRKGDKPGFSKPRSKHSVNRELRLLSRIFSLAISKREAAENPCSDVELFKIAKNRKRRLHSEERTKLFEAIANPEMQERRAHLLTIVVLDLNTGLRKTELLSLKPDDIDFLNNVIKVRETKNGEDREVEMNATARAILLSLVAAAKENGWEYLFTNARTGTRYKDVKRSFNSAMKEAGITGFRFHDLRHTFASHAGDDPTVSIAALAETLGHKDWKTTMQYTHASKQSKLRVVEALEKETEFECHKIVTKGKRQAS